jgi:hypothetical protein
MTVFSETPADGPHICDASSSRGAVDTKRLFDEICQKIRAKALPPNERSLFETYESSFKDNLEIILHSEDELERDAALKIAFAALSLGYYHEGNPTIVKDIEATFNQRRVANAQKARSRPFIDEIIKEEAENVLKYRGRYRADHGYDAKTLAEAIQRRVIIRLNKSDAPREWKVQDATNPTKTEKTRVRAHIRRHLRRKWERWGLG